MCNLYQSVRKIVRDKIHRDSIMAMVRPIAPKNKWYKLDKLICSGCIERMI